MIKYLIKFVSRLEHAKMLQDGHLFMRPMPYYRLLEEGQGDELEGAISHSIFMFKNTQWPIYCFYSVDDSDVISNGNIKIDKRCIDDFKCKDGYIVIINFSEFEKMLPIIDTEGYQLTAGKVSYRNIAFEELANLMKKETLDNVFVKRPKYSYQKEYRIVITKNISTDVYEVVYKMDSDIKNISNIINVSNLKIVDNNLYIPKELLI
jgi:hypothetical protein